MTENTISVIIPCYNAEKYIQQCYEQIIKQTYTDLDIIFINDGSTDKTKIILTSLAEKDSRIRLINQDNKGVSMARNAGLDLVSNTSGGGYISFLDVDDELEAEYFEILLKDIKTYNADIVACHFKEKDPLTGDFHKLDLPKYDYFIDKNIDFFKAYFNCNNSHERFMISVWNKLFKKEIILDRRFEHELKKSEDLLFMMTLFFASPKLYLENRSLYIYNNYSNLVNMKYKNKWGDGVYAYIEIYNMACLLGDELRTDAEVFFGFMCFSLLMRCIRERRKDLYFEKSFFFKNCAKMAIKKKITKKSRRICLRIYLLSKNIFWFMGRLIFCKNAK